jgi:2-oxoglutarate ferredoxin oxidoreductase subunit beta
VLRAAANHPGTALVEIYQNCNIFNDGAFDVLKDPETRESAALRLEDGQPMRFGIDGQAKGVRRSDDGGLEICEADDPAVLTHRAATEDPTTAFALSRLTGVTPMGVFRDVNRASYDELLNQQVDDVVAREGQGDLMALLHGGDTWAVAADDSGRRAPSPADAPR